MKLRTNLLPVRGRSLAAALTLIWGLALAGGAGIVWQISDARKAAAEQQRLQAQLERLRERRLDLKGDAAERITESEASALLERVRSINAVSDVQGPPATTLFAMLEAHLPDEAYLLSLRHARGTGELHLVAEAPSPEPLAALLRALEAEPTFDHVMLVRQSRESRDERPAVQFEIKARSAAHD